MPFLLLYKKRHTHSLSYLPSPSLKQVSDLSLFHQTPTFPNSYILVLTLLLYVPCYDSSRPRCHHYWHAEPIRWLFLDSCLWSWQLWGRVLEKQASPVSGLRRPQLYLRPTRRPPRHRFVISKLKELVSGIPNTLAHCVSVGSFQGCKMDHSSFCSHHTFPGGLLVYLWAT